MYLLVQTKVSFLYYDEHSLQLGTMCSNFLNKGAWPMFYQPKKEATPDGPKLKSQLMILLHKPFIRNLMDLLSYTLIRTLVKVWFLTLTMVTMESFLVSVIVTFIFCHVSCPCQMYGPGGWEIPPTAQWIVGGHPEGSETWSLGFPFIFTDSFLNISSTRCAHASENNSERDAVLAPKLCITQYSLWAEFTESLSFCPVP